MGIDLRGRVACAVLAGVATGMLALPATAFAAQGPDNVVANSCAATVEGQRGEPLTVDAGALLQEPGVVTVGLGTASDGTDGAAQPLATVPVSDTLNGLGVSRTPVLSDAAGSLCDGAKTTLNAVGDTVQTTLPGDDATETPSEDAPPAEDTPPPDSPNRPGQEPGTDSSPDSAVSPLVLDTADTQGTTSGGAVLTHLLDNSFDSLRAISLESMLTFGPPIQAPDVNAAIPGGNPVAHAAEPGDARALLAGEQERLPLLLAVIALALVATLLSRTLYRRKAL